jgi:hypothetical protein
MLQLVLGGMGAIGRAVDMTYEEEIYGYRTND